MSMNKYFLRNRGVYSNISDDEIRQRFESRMKAIGYTGTWLRSVRGTYEQDDIQARWEEFSNGFRQGEDSVTPRQNEGRI
jgi:hypothetical protein